MKGVIMEYKFNFKTEEEKENLIQIHSDKFVKETIYTLYEQYIIFTDEMPIIEPTEIELMQNEIKTLKEELTQIKTSIASITTLLTKTLEER